MNVQQSKDRGILLRDILDGAEDLTSKDKSWALTARYAGACAWNTIERSQRNMCVEPVNTTESGKSVNLLGNAGGAGAKTRLYAILVEFKDGIPTKAISNSDGKTYCVYRVANGTIRIKDKEYLIKLQDGFYIIRKLSVSECKRLQTVPEWYEFPVSNAQAYKMLGNGWTVDVIAHLIKACLEPDTEFVPKQLSFFD